MALFLLWLFFVKLQVVYLESRWEKVTSHVLPARFVSGRTRWSDKVLIIPPLPSGNHSQEREVCRGGDSRRLGAVEGQMSPGWQLTHLWAVTPSERQRKAIRSWCLRTIFCLPVNMAHQSECDGAVNTCMCWTRGSSWLLLNPKNGPCKNLPPSSREHHTDSATSATSGASAAST